MTTNVNFESIRHPSTHCLNEMGGESSLCKCGRTTGPEGVSGDGCREVLAETCDEPSSCGDGTVRTKPEMGVKKEKMVAKFKVM